MILRNGRGQVLLYSIVFLPLLLLIFGLLYRSGTTLLLHNKTQSHCDRKVLEAMAKEAEGLSELGKINPKSKTVIDLRRRIDRALQSGALAPGMTAMLLATRIKLVQMQKTLATQQAMIESKTDEAANLVLARKSETLSTRHLEEYFSLDSGLSGLVKEVRPYKGETAAPLELKKDSPTQTGKLRVHVESLLQKWPGLTGVDDFQVDCRSKIKMTKLEEPWQVVLTK